MRRKKKRKRKNNFLIFPPLDGFRDILILLISLIADSVINIRMVLDIPFVDFPGCMVEGGPNEEWWKQDESHVLKGHNGSLPFFIRSNTTHFPG